jgi:prevent-host-death family protein
MGSQRLEDIRPISDFSGDPQRVVDQVRKSGRPLVLTTEGQEVAVLLSIEAFEELQPAVNADLQQAVDEAEQGLTEGRWVEHDVVQAKLKHWAAGGR